MKTGNTIGNLVAAIAIVLLANGIARADGADPGTNGAEPRMHSAEPLLDGKGVHLAVGFIGRRLDLQDDAYDALYKAGVDLASEGLGVEFLAGYRFGPRLSLNLRLASSTHDTGRSDLDAGFGLGILEVAAHMRPGERVQPFLSGGLGGGGIVLSPQEGDDVTLEGAAFTAGGGVDVLLSDRWTLGFAYRAAVIDYESATIDLPGSAPVTFRGAGLAHEFGFRWDFRI